MAEPIWERNHKTDCAIILVSLEIGLEKIQIVYNQFNIKGITGFIAHISEYSLCALMTSREYFDSSHHHLA